MTILRLRERSSLLTPIDRVLCLLGLLSLAFSLYATSVGFRNTIFDFHGFRQAQTAISADSMLHGGSFFRYETPVFGPPWSLPFEFPLYQGIVAGLAKTFSTPLDQTGRFVSIVFYYLCFLPLASILFQLGFRGTRMIPCLALFAVSPIYVFVSRLFMIESTALFFSLMYAEQMLRLTIGRQPWRWRFIAGAAFFGVVAGLVKVTTLAPFFALGSGLAAWRLWRDIKEGRFKSKSAIIAVFFCLATPVAATLSWTRFADHVKEQNPFGLYLMSHKLNAWTFGPLVERLHPSIYLGLVHRANYQVGSILVSMLVLTAYIWLFRKCNWIAVACIALYIGTIMLFFNLHVIHEYYPYSIAIFLLLATGVLIAEVANMPGKRAWIGVVLLVFELGVCGIRYRYHYYPVQKANAQGRPDAAGFIERTTSSQKAIVILGLDWSPEFPYQSHRSAIMNTTLGRKPESWSLLPLKQAIQNQGTANISALVVCDRARSAPLFISIVQILGMPEGAIKRADDCDIYERADRDMSPNTP